MRKGNKFLLKIYKKVYLFLDFCDNIYLVICA